MKIGIFDSGLGGLFMTRAIRTVLPEHDLVYLGDTLHVPYGRRSQGVIYDLTRKAIDYLFTHQDCQIVILACNTASAAALRKLQQTWLVKHYPTRRILGVIVPTLESAARSAHTSIGLLATESTVNAGVYEEELKKINPDITLHARAAPLLVPLIESSGIRYIPPILKDYLDHFAEKNIQSLILGCTHYPVLKPLLHDMLSQDIQILDQTEVVPEKLKDYLRRHPQHDQLIDKNSRTDFLVTDLTAGYQNAADNIFGKPLLLSGVTY